jgi:hypothetical protein
MIDAGSFKILVLVLIERGPGKVRTMAHLMK